MKKYKPRTRAICRECGQEMMRNQVVNHWLKEHRDRFYEKAPSGGWGAVTSHAWLFLADALPGEVR